MKTEGLEDTTTYAEMLLEDIDRNIKVIRKYTAWVTFVILLSFFGAIGMLVLTASSLGA